MVDPPPDRCQAVPCLAPSEPLTEDDRMRVHPIERTTATDDAEVASEPRLDQVWTIHRSCFDPALHQPV